MANVLTDPPFAADPPVKFNVDAKVIGLVVGIVAVLFAILDLFGVFGALGWTALCGACGFPALWLVGSLATLVADVLAAVGGFRVFNLNAQGKHLIVYGLALAVAAQIVTIVGNILAYSNYAGGFAFAGLIGFIFWTVIRGAVYYMVIISRFPGEAPLVPRVTPGGYGGYGSPPPPPPPA